MVRKGLDWFIKKIIHCERAVQLGQNDELNSQNIGRSYYQLQSMLGNVNTGNHSSATEIRTKILFWLRQLRSETDCIRDFRSGLEEVIELDVPERDLAREITFIFLNHALNAFERSYTFGNNVPDNASYRGMCCVDLVRLNGHLRRLSEREILEKLQKAEILLESALGSRQGTEREDLYKDYSRLGECKFLLAQMVEDDARKSALYNEVVNCQRLAMMEFRKRNPSLKLKP
jgi:hypothetical protein